jgi:hypothetical protein
MGTDIKQYTNNKTKLLSTNHTCPKLAAKVILTTSKTIVYITVTISNGTKYPIFNEYENILQKMK